jgi:hypothetical protein
VSSEKELRYYRGTREEFIDTFSGTKKWEDVENDKRKSQ